MGKNKNRNRRNKKNNEQVLDIEIKFSSSANINGTEVSKTKRRSNSKKMSCSNPKNFQNASNYKVWKENSSEAKEQNFTSFETKTLRAQPLSEVYEKEDKHVRKTVTKKRQHYNGSNYEKEIQPFDEVLELFKENVNQVKNETPKTFTKKKQHYTRSNYEKEVQPFDEVLELFKENVNQVKNETSKTFTKKKQHYTGSNYEKEVQPFDEVSELFKENVNQVKNETSVVKATSTSSKNYGSKNYKAKPCIEKESQVKNEQALVKTTSTSATIYTNKNSVVGKLTKNDPKVNSYPESMSPSKTTGAIPKSKQHFGNSTATEYLKIKEVERNSQLFSKNVQIGVRKYENNWEKFKRLYLTWKSQREKTIKELEELVKNVHIDQKGFNKGNLLFKELNVVSREIKSSNQSPAVDFLTSLATFVTDAASGITSVVQACNVDVHTAAYKKIMESDAEITKLLHAARSQCLEEYRNVEEMIRECHLKTFGNTMDDISDTLKVDDLLSQIKSAKGDDCIGQIIDGVAVFIKRNANLQVMGEIKDSFQVFLDSNPAVVEACKSAGKALYGVYDTWGRDHKQGRASIQGNMSIVSNQLMLVEQRREIDQLRSIVQNDYENQAKLESEIHYAISSLEVELMEMNEIFENHNRQYGNPWYF